MTSEASRLQGTAHDHDARLQHALRAVKVGVWYIDLIRNNRVWSQEVAALMGLPRDAPLDYQRMLEAIHADDRERIRTVAMNALAAGAAFEADCRVVWPDRSVHWVAVRGQVHLNTSGAPYCIEGVVQDIEERKRLETELEESQHTLSSLISHLPGMLYRGRNEPRWSDDFVSEGVLSLTGYSASDFTSQKVAFGELIHPDDRQRVWESVQSALTEQRRFQLTYRIHAASGEEKWVWEQGSGVFSPDGELQYLEGFITDVTEGKRTEEQRIHLEARLQQAQKMEALGTLAGGIAHDFNNVLAAIRGNAALAMADVPPDSPALTSINEIKRSAVRAADLVRQILAFSRQESALRRAIDLRPVVAEALRLLRATLPALIEIRSEFALGLPHVVADPTQIHQIIMNLGVNAAQAIGARSGRIQVRLDPILVSLDGARRSVALTPGRYLQMQVADDGCGMDEATLERVYDPFFTTKPAGQGTGLGLSVVHGIVRAHEGAISVETEPGAGTTFSLYFPAAPTAAAADSETAPPASRGRGQRILYVDDEDALVFLAERALQRFGYKVTGHVDPKAALEAFRAQPTDFDFVVTDLSMPGMSGADLARELLRIRPDIPIVLASGYVRPEDVESARKHGVRDVILKPNSIDDLARVIDKTLSDEEARRASSAGRD